MKKIFLLAVAGVVFGHSTCFAQTQIAYSFSAGPADEIRLVSTGGIDQGALVSPTTGISPWSLGQSSVTGQLFWSDIVDDVIYTAAANGSGQSVGFSTVFSGDSGSTVQSISVDSNNSRIFWADSTNDAIRVANFDGTNATTLYTSSVDAGTPKGVRYDATNNRVLWGDSTSDSIMQFDLNTMSASQLVGLDAVFGSGSYTPKGLDFNDTHLFFADSGPDKIFMSDLDGSNAVELLDLSTFYAANGNFGDTDSGSTVNDLLLVDDTLYWTDGNSGKRGIYGYDLDSSTGFQLLHTEPLTDYSAAPLNLAAYNFSAVPEPGSALVLSFLATAAALRRRRY